MKKIFLFLLITHFLSSLVFADEWRLIRPNWDGNYSVLTAQDLDQMTRLQFIKSLRREISEKKNIILIQQLYQLGSGMLAALLAGICGIAIYEYPSCKSWDRSDCALSGLVSAAIAPLMLIPVIHAQNEKNRLSNLLEHLEEKLKSLEHHLSK